MTSRMGSLRWPLIHSCRPESALRSRLRDVRRITRGVFWRSRIQRNSKPKKS